jgi:hypothetical protein
MRQLALFLLAIASFAACSDPVVDIVDARVSPDAAPRDAASPDAVAVDAGSMDAVAPDASPPDSGFPDAGPADVFVIDSGPADSGVFPDAAAPDAEPVDAGPSCTDNLQNQGEIRIDCGGPCGPCSACPGTGNLLRNPGFETASRPGAGQGILPDEWVVVTDSPDTYSNDGSFGLSPSGFGNFTGVTAFEGIRWVSGWSQVPERFGQVLTSTLTAGAYYRLSGHLHQSVRADLNYPGAYEVGLADAISRTATAALGRFTNTSSNAWVRREFEFVAPPASASLPLLFFTPVAGPQGTAYPGADRLELIQLSDCP